MPMKPTSATANLYLTLAAIAVAAAFFIEQRSQISSLTDKLGKMEAQLEQDRSLLVSHGLQIVNNKGMAVAQIKAVGNGSTLSMESFSDKSEVTSSVSLGTVSGAALTIGQVSVPATAADNYHWASYGPSGLYVQSGLGGDAKNPYLIAKLGIDATGAYESLTDEHDKLLAKTSVRDGLASQMMKAGNRAMEFITLSDGVQGRGMDPIPFPVSFHLSASTEDRSQASWIGMHIPSESSPNSATSISMTAWDGRETSVVTPGGINLVNRLGNLGFVLSSKGGRGGHAYMTLENQEIAPVGRAP